MQPMRRATSSIVKRRARESPGASTMGAFAAGIWRWWLGAPPDTDDFAGASDWSGSGIPHALRCPTHMGFRAAAEPSIGIRRRLVERPSARESRKAPYRKARAGSTGWKTILDKVDSWCRPKQGVSSRCAEAREEHGRAGPEEGNERPGWIRGNSSFRVDPGDSRQGADARLRHVCDGRLVSRGIRVPRSAAKGVPRLLAA